MSNKKFAVIVADPPYDFSDPLKMSDVRRGASSNYNTMSISEIMALDIKNISCDDGSLLALWVPSSLLQEGLNIMNAWGFTHKQTYVWVKTKKNAINLVKKEMEYLETNIKTFSIKEWKTYFQNLFSSSIKHMLGFGLGRLFRQTHEICLIGINNTGIYKKLKNKSQRSVCFAENLKHSSKPEDLQDSLDLMFPGIDGKCELFARRQRQGWECLGNEVKNGEDIRVSLSKL